MIKNYLRTAINIIKHHRSFSFLNIFGLGIGMCCSILIFLWVADELSFDKFNTNEKEIYRVTSDITDSKAAVIPVPMGPAIKTTIPGVVNVTRVSPTATIFTVNNRKFEEKRGFYADTNFLRVFSYPLLNGNIAEALSTPDAVVITETLAKKYFGNTDAIGKVLPQENDIKANSLTVRGILKDIPANSHLQFDFLLPMKLYESHIDYDGSWGNFDMYTYVQMDKSFQPTAAKLGFLNKALFDLYAKNDEHSNKGTFTLQPLADIHLRSGQLLLDVDGQGNIEFVRIFSLVAFFIIIIACINFMNLSTAMAGQRAKEVGLRKTIGALRSQLIGQFLGETVLLSAIALLAGIVMAGLLLPLFNSLTAKEISFSLLSVKTIALLISAPLVVGILAGAYPAFYLSAFVPIKVLKGVKSAAGHTSFFRNGLVVLQFSIAIILIIGTMVVFDQLRFIKTRNIGFNKENLMYIKMPQVGDLGSNYQALKASLSQNPDISDYSIIKYLPTSLTTGTTDVQWPGRDPGMELVFPHLGVDENFASTFGIQLVAGRFFAKDFQGDNNNYVINETALRTMKMDAASVIGTPLSVNGRKGEIIGVLRDFNFKSVHHVVEPLILKHNGSGGYLVVRTAPANMKNILARVKNVFKDVYADYPFSYGFVDEDLSRLYFSEERMSKLFGIFTALSVLVSCLGLFGLSAYTAQKRIKEIGIRRVLGASITGIVKMLSVDFLKPVLLGAAIAFPTAWWIMNKWLEGFAYRVSIGWTVFVLAGLLALVIAFVTIGFQAVRAAGANPVRALRGE